MKKLGTLLIGLLLFSCGGSDDGPDPIPPDPIVDLDPVAVNDTKTTVEDTALVISDLLDNDTVVDNATITNFDSNSANNGSIVDNRNGSYTYTPPVGFVGIDTFSYTLCDDDNPATCSTATVTIEVTDEGSPVAYDDSYDVAENTVVNFTEFLDNDDLTDDAVISAVDDSGSSGSVILESNGSITYTAATDFSGQDSFTYTICDDDTPTATCATATITVTVHEGIAFNIPSELSDYYQNLVVTEVPELNIEFVQTHTIAKHTTILSYSQRHNYLYDADEDESNADNVILMYTGESRYWEEYSSGNNAYQPQTFNTEHVYPQSLLESDVALTDLHHLRVCDADINSDRSNYPFEDGSGSYALGDNKWFPGDDWRGDVARMIMYLNIRYGETFEKVGSKELFLEWNIADPVSTFEIQRNNIIEGAQGVRNPFIDNPYLATLIWGGNPAENKW